MKGRPITTEEFERLLMVTPKVVGEEAAPSWKRYLEGLWWSGLRLAESLELYWDRPDKLSVDLSGRHPMLLIPDDLEKGHKNRILPLAPEAAEFLLRTPEHKRRGRIFSLRCPADRDEMSMLPNNVSNYVCAIGKAANVKVEDTKRKGKPFVKYASCHDLRRSFGERWAARVMPNVLMELMRHESIDTTMKYYVGRNAQRTADQLWAAFEAEAEKSNISVTSGDFGEDAGEADIKKTSSPHFSHASSRVMVSACLARKTSNLTGGVLFIRRGRIAQSDAARQGLGRHAADGCEKCGLVFQGLTSNREIS